MSGSLVAAPTLPLQSGDHLTRRDAAFVARVQGPSDQGYRARNSPTRARALTSSPLRSPRARSW